MERQELSTWGRQMSAEPSAENTYPLEAKRHELWHNLVQGFAPSLSEHIPAPVFATSVLPMRDSTDVESLNTRIINDMVETGKFGFIPDSDKKNPQAIYTMMAIHHGDESSQSGAIHRKVLKHAMIPISKTPTTLGLHLTQNENGIIFLPENTDRAGTWEMFVRLNRAFGPEGQRLIIKHCIGGLPSLVSDLMRHMHNLTVIELEKLMGDEGYNHLLDLRFSGLQSEASLQAGLITVTQMLGRVGPYRHFPEAARTIREIGNRRIPTLFETPKSEGDAKVITALNGLSHKLNCGFNDVRQIAQKSIGLSLSVEELYKKYPGDPERAKKLLSALVFIDGITLHAEKEAKRAPKNFQQIVSPLTLRLFRSDLDALNLDTIPPKPLEGMSDAILSHELSHELLLILATRLQAMYGSAWRNFLNNRAQEQVIESMAILLGYREAVEKCVYYNESADAKQSIDEGAKFLATLIPEDRERALLHFLENQATSQQAQQ